MPIKLLIIVAAVLTTTTSCVGKTTNIDTEYTRIDLNGEMEQIGLSFIENSKEKTCKDMLPTEKIETGGLLFSDTTIIDDNAATAFKPKSFITFWLSECIKKDDKNSVCGFTVESAFGVKMISTTRDQKNMYLIHNANILVHIKIDGNGKPYSFATKKIGYGFADAISTNGIAEYSNIDQEYERLFKKYSKKK